MDITVIPFAFPGLPGVRAAFTTARGGAGRGTPHEANIAYSAGGDPTWVAANRKSLRQALGFDTWHSLRQVHGDAVAFDPPAVADDQCSGVEADGSATNRPGCALVVKTADCQPILLAHESGRYVAGLHAGWRGNVLDFPVSGVRAFCDRYGLHPRELLAVRGPSLGPAAAQFTNFEAEFGAGFRDFYRPGSQTVDLWSLTRAQLVRAGLAPERIFGLDLCTRELPLFHSYRRDKHCGRQASLIWIARG